jgi:hypothetical protein
LTRKNGKVTSATEVLKCTNAHAQIQQLDFPLAGVHIACVFLALLKVCPFSPYSEYLPSSDLCCSVFSVGEFAMNSAQNGRSSRKQNQMDLTVGLCFLCARLTRFRTTMKPAYNRVYLGLLLTMFSFACDTTEAPIGDESSIKMEILEASCTEAWIKIALAKGIEPRTLKIVRSSIGASGDSTTIFSWGLASSESLVVDESLLPSRGYSYSLVRPVGFEEVRVTATIRTLDTTSHQFNWIVDTLGVTASSLEDVTIVSDSLAYVVGEVYLRDSTGQLEPAPYNAAIWNGRAWNAVKVPYIYQGSPYAAPIEWVFADNSSSVWFGNSVRWNGTRYENIDFGVFFIGRAPNDMWKAANGYRYLVGDDGAVCFTANEGRTWYPIASGTTKRISDVFGSIDTVTGAEEILCVSSQDFTPTAQIVKLVGQGAEQSTVEGLPSSIRSMWFKTNRKYYVVGYGIYTRTAPRSRWDRVPLPITSYSTAVSGTGLNDIFVGGTSWQVLHFNGVSWRVISPSMPGNCSAIDARDNMVMIVGSIGNRGLVMKSSR